MATQQDYCNAGAHSYNNHSGHWQKCFHCGTLRNARTGEVKPTA